MLKFRVKAPKNGPGLVIPEPLSLFLFVSEVNEPSLSVSHCTCVLISLLRASG